jgi:hypothetical protein
MAGAFISCTLFFTALFMRVALYCLPLNVFIFFRMWRGFRFWGYTRAIHALTFGLSAAFLALIFVFGRRWFEFVL